MSVGFERARGAFTYHLLACSFSSTFDWFCYFLCQM